MQPRGQFFLRKHAIRARLAAGKKLAVRSHMGIERHLIVAMTPAPEAMAIARLVHRDAVDPGAKAGLSAEPMDGPKDAKEDFLGKVEGFIPIAQQVHGQLDDHALVLGDEVGAGALVACGTALHQRRLAPANIRPPDDPRLLH